MEIVNLYLKRYKRLMLSLIETFEITPTQSIQLMLGTNGSGKSSVLAELTPWPGHHQDFAKGGEKRFECHHRGHHYVLHSVYDSGTGKHSFVRDKQELNDGMTGAVQKELVTTYFGLTRDIVDLLVGLQDFTDLTTAKRREWLTRLSPLDMTYAFELYHRTKGAHRDQQGVIKHLNKRMTQENHDLPDEQTRSRCRARIETLTQHLNALFTAKDPQTFTRHHYSDFENRLNRCLKQGRKLLTQGPGVTGRYQGVDDFTRQKQQIESGLQRNSDVLDHLQKSYQQLMKNQPSLDAEGLTPEAIQQLKQQRQQQSDHVQQLKAQTPPKTQWPVFDLNIEQHGQETLQQLFHELTMLMNAIPENPTGYYSRQEGQRAQQRHQELTRQRRELNLKQSTLAERIARLRGCEAVACPACQHEFVPGVDPKELPRLQKELEQMGETDTELEKELTTLGTYLEEFQTYLGYVKQCRDLCQHHPSFQPLWDFFVEHLVFFRTPQKWLPEANHWLAAMQHRMAIQDAEQALSVTQHKLRYVEAIDQDQLTRTDQQRQQIEADIEARTTQQRQYQNAQQHITTEERRLQRYQQDLQQLIHDLETLIADVKEETHALFQACIDKETQTTQVSLAHANEELSRADVRAGVLNDLNQQHEVASREQHDLAVLLKALSPTEGLIGQYLKTFMESVVELINAIIGRIWTYSLKVLPSQVEKEELDYKFPLDVEDGAITPSDIAKGSAGQKDVVNFAFRLLVMKFLDMRDFPLYLDELGSFFDEQHRINLIDFLDNLVEQDQVGQLFFISHYASTHGAFQHAEICVLNPTNISVPKHYNGHVTIT